MQRELNTITMKLSASQQDVDKMASISNKENHRSSNTLSLVHVGTNTEDFTQEKLNGDLSCKSDNRSSRLCIKHIIKWRR